MKSNRGTIGEKMKGRGIIVVAVIAVIVTGGLVAVIRGGREPEYQGKSLSYWAFKAVEACSNQVPVGVFPRGFPSPEVEAAFLAIGTNGIPYYLEWVQYRVPRSVRIQTYLAGRSRQLVRHNWRPQRNIHYRAVGASVALGVLREAAVPAIPTLVEYATDETGSRSPYSRAIAFSSLGHIGPAALPTLLHLMTNGSATVKNHAMQHATLISTNAAVVGQVRLLLQDRDEGVRKSATNTLGRIGESPEM